MQWDDFSFFGGDSGDVSTSDFGSYSPTDYAGFDLTGGTPAAAPAPTLGGGGGLDTSGLYGGMNQGLGGFSPQLNTALGAPGAAAGTIPGLGQLGGLNSLQGLLGVGGGLAGLLGAIASGGQTGATMPKMGTAQTAQVNQANQAIQPAALGQLPLQQTQASMLQALASGQIPPGFAQLIQSAYDPAYQNAAQRSITAAQKAGFYDNPLSSPVGGAIMGPAAAQLQGQQANSLLGLIQSLPQLFNAPIGNQIGAAQSQSGNLLNAAQLGTGKTTSVPIGAQAGTAIGGGLQGASQAIGQNNQQQLLGQILQNQMKGNGGITMSMQPEQ